MPIKPVLVIGGAGYIGSHMVLTLERAGYYPVVLDNLSKGHRDAVRGAEFFQGEMNDARLLQTLFDKYKFEAVLHFAALIEVAESVKDPIRYYQNNLAASINLLEIMIKNKVRNFIFSSSAAVYGESDQIQIDEEHLLSPVNPYGKSKYMLEEILKDLADCGQLQFSILRYFNAAGADPDSHLAEQHQPESHLIPLVLEAAAGLRSQIKIFGNDYPTADGTCVRDYIHVMDICHAHLLAMNDLIAQRHANQIYNLGNGLGYSVMQVIETARRITKKEINVVIGERRAGDPARLVANAELAKQQLGWKPKYPELEIIMRHAWQAYLHVKQACDFFSLVKSSN